MFHPCHHSLLIIHSTCSAKAFIRCSDAARPGSCCVSVACCFSWNVRRLFDCSVSCDFRGPLSRRGNSLIRELRHSSPSPGRAPLMSPSVQWYFWLCSHCLSQSTEAKKKKKSKLARTITVRNVHTKNEIVASVAAEGGNCSVMRQSSKCKKKPPVNPPQRDLPLTFALLAPV